VTTPMFTGPTCICGHPLDIHWPGPGPCRVRDCTCTGYSLARVTPERPSKPAATHPMEKDWLQAVVDLAAFQGALVYHTHDSRRSASGFPDLVIVVHGRVLFRELKRDGNKPTAEQRRWLTALAQAGQDAAVWTFPQDWPLVVEAFNR
jgi:hypothetical protein